eukprot:3312109-Prymnesium_polylepis.1
MGDLGMCGGGAARKGTWDGGCFVCTIASSGQTAERALAMRKWRRGRDLSRGGSGTRAVDSAVRALRTARAASCRVPVSGLRCSQAAEGHELGIECDVVRGAQLAIICKRCSVFRRPCR